MSALMIAGERLRKEVKEIFGEIPKEIIPKVLERGIYISTYVGVNNGWYGFRIVKSVTGIEQKLYECEPRYPICQDAQTVGLAVLGAIRLINEKGLLQKLISGNQSQ